MYDDLSGALEAGDDAFGVSMQRPGTGRTPADDRLLALGYPHMLVPVDVPVQWKKLETAGQVLKAHPLEVGEWPRELFSWLLARWDVACMPHLWDEHPARAPETPHDLDTLIAGPHETGDTHLLLYALEAVHGSLAVAERAVAALEAWPDESWGHEPGNVDLVRGLHFVLLRLSAGARERLVARLEAVFERVAASCRFESGALHKTVAALDLALHGRRGVERSGYRPDKVQLSLWDLPFALDDPAWVAEVALPLVSANRPGHWAKADVRTAFIGGDAVVQALCENVVGFRSEQRRRLVAQLGRFAHPSVRPAMEQLATLAGAKKEARAWLKASG